MSMLAERRRKQKWSLNPRGKHWSEDTNKFGQKLLEKMGWSAGKGLGAKEDGITEHIKVSYKNDSKGMGFKETDDQWTEHELNFTQLLSSLSGGKEKSESETENELKLESLEKKSQNSRARVHYHKFTRGKDLSRYSEKDLANIFGKKSLKEKKKPDKDEVTLENNGDHVENKSFGVETHNGGNMLDYFKKKLPNYKKHMVNNDTKIIKENSESESERPSFGFGFNVGARENKVQSSFISYIKESECADLENKVETENVMKKKKKLKKNEKADAPLEETKENGPIQENQIELVQDLSPKTKQKRKFEEDELQVAFTPLKKKFKNFENLDSLDDEAKIERTPSKKCKKKKSKRKSDEDNTPKMSQCEDVGLTNPAFDPMFNNVRVEKHSLEVINEEEEHMQEDFKESVEENDEKGTSATKDKSKKKRKTKIDAAIENSGFEDNSISELPQIDESCTNSTVQGSQKNKTKKSKKLKKYDELGIQNSAFDENFNDSYDIQETCEEFEVKKKSKKRKTVGEGVANPCFEDNMVSLNDSQEMKKRKKNEKKMRIDIDLNLETNIEDPQDVQDFHKNASKAKKRKKDYLTPAENPCFNPDDNTLCLDNNNTSLYEVKRKKKPTDLGIENPGLDLTTPSPKKKEEKIPQELDMPIMDDEVMLNIISTPVVKKPEGVKSVQRRKSVRFSDVNQRIFINNLDSPADLRKNGFSGIDNEGYDKLGNHIEENIDSLSKQLDDYQAEVENDINEAKMEIMVGEMGDPNGENEILSNGEAKLKFKHANFGKIPPWLRRNGEVNAKTSYRHLIKGDIVLGFKNTNLHEIKGYATKQSVNS